MGPSLVIAGCILITEIRVAGLRPARRLNFFVRPKKRSKEWRPNSLPAFGGFPALHSNFELTRKLACGSDILVRIPQNLYSTPAASHGGRPEARNQVSIGRWSSITLPSFARLPGGTNSTSPRILVSSRILLMIAASISAGTPPELSTCRRIQS